MYERNAILIDRYFADLFGYDKHNNLKSNSVNYFELVSKLEEYQISSETENDIMTEFEKIANRIKETQKLQEVLNKRNLKYTENRKALFENLDEDEVILRKKFKKIEDEIAKNNEEIRINTEKFVEEIRDFNEKSEVRSSAGRERRAIESDYQNALDITIDNFSKIDRDKLKEIKNFIKLENQDDQKEEIKEKILKNGAKEKVPFDINAITKAIDVSLDIEQKRVEILLSVYDKTTKLLEEIKNDSVKIERHKKIVKDAKSKLEYLNVISEYIILFLDNERMNTLSGEKEHQKIMMDACDNLQNDLVEIQNMYTLLVKEMTGKSSKKAYKELYNLEYLIELQENAKKFEQNISKLNMLGTVIYPDYWRIEGMQKIYETFYRILTEEYEKDLSEYEPMDITWDVNKDILKLEDEDSEVEFTEYTDMDEDAEKGEDNDEIVTETEDEEYSEDEDGEDEEEELSEEDEENSLEDDIDIFEEYDLDEDDVEEDEDEEEEFHWDEEDEDDELDFGVDNYIVESADKDINNDNDIDEEARDKEIDQILGFFDEEDSEENTEEEEQEDKDNQEDNENDKKKAGLFGKKKK